MEDVRVRTQQALLRVPEVTIYFWIIKILATTVGETGADFLAENLGLGLTGTSLIMSGLLAIALAWQFKKRRYVPGVYWLAVVLISIVGTLITDNLVDNLGVALSLTTEVFTVLLILVFAAWYASEKTLAIHSISTTKREAFYWLAILFTFALGTAAGDLLAEGIDVGYWKSALLFAAMIAVVAVVYFRSERMEVPGFWAAYILTRPLGASLGDYLSQPKRNGGLALGTVGTSALFVLVILGVVVFLTITRRDQGQAAEA